MNLYRKGGSFDERDSSTWPVSKEERQQSIGNVVVSGGWVQPPCQNELHDTSDDDEEVGNV